ncbi:conserved hypothetical protein [Trichinella spiralis]|uniref:hypothetical protein n=1 Tax=Trichinella spiralis TaxID=6334 RepID=UPI0001EFB65C|nr:conserved hypothetical protein [Trichinella spiralis]
MCRPSATLHEKIENKFDLLNLETHDENDSTEEAYVLLLLSLYYQNFLHFINFIETKRKVYFDEENKISKHIALINCTEFFLLLNKEKYCKLEFSQGPRGASVCSSVQKILCRANSKV